MATVEYIARRSLAPSHVLGATYLVAFQATSLRRTPRHKRRVQETISGKTETLFYGTVYLWDVTLAPVQLTEIAIVREFLDSTADGQVFTFDAYGSLGLAVMPVAVKRDDDENAEDPFLPLGTGGQDDFVQVGFRVRQA